MSDKPTGEECVRKQARRSFRGKPVVLGGHWSYNLSNDPKRLVFVLSRYKFAAKLACKEAEVLELGCSEGLGAPLLSEFGRHYTGVDADGEAIAVARRNWGGERVTFLEDDFLGKKYGHFDSVVSLDVVEHVSPDAGAAFVDTLADNLNEEGVCVVGTPNATASAYASEASRQAHVNLFDGARLSQTLGRRFNNVFLFAMNDEVVHTGFLPMAHYLLAVACYRKEGRRPHDG